MKKNKNYLGLEIILTLVLALGFVNAFSPISGYSSTNPLQVYAGESKEIPVNVYLSPEENNLEFSADIVEGSEIISFVDKKATYDASQSSEGVVKFKVNVPAGTPIGTEYNIVLRFSDVQSASSGMIGFALKADNAFKVVVVEKPAIIEETPQGEGIGLIGWVIGIIIVIAIILIIYFILKKRNE